MQKIIIRLIVVLSAIKLQAQTQITFPNSNNNIIWLEANSNINTIEQDNKPEKSQIIFCQYRGPELEKSWSYRYGVFHFSVEKNAITTITLNEYNNTYKSKAISLETLLNEAETNKKRMSAKPYIQTKEITYFYIEGNTVRVCKNIYVF